ncbi:hypothetical protein FVEG_11386 [Fusarium verticillioides 7600]|uniref:Uncharacterized protein n=1 Tax=Gibberella moniliformis (strain M3125 / FGSC 7600) TaxID=334819 RepID=W7MNT6_GIBM7|nr:hypothetical protein FVEG_11386 [Fusarium verticillioides 7600]EWG52741.1 hypothetical protein FVEG_11386 [Fusarium verticillioides 7600]
MLRLQPTTIKIATRDISDAERRSRYRKHLLSRQKADKKRDDLIQHDREATLEDALNTKIVTPTTDSSIVQDTPGSNGRNESDGEEGIGSSVPLLDYGTISSDETRFVDVDHGINRLHRQPDQHRLPFRPRQSLGDHEDADTAPVHTQPHDNGSDGSVTDEDEHDAIEQLLAATVDGLTYETEEVNDDLSQSSGELMDPPEDAGELSIPPTGEGLEPTTPRRQFPVYSDRLPVEEQPQTPRQLPEARHQSRFDGAYTAPVRGRRVRVEIDDAPMTARRRRAGRNTSPVGLRTPGFQGLYGGSENADDV